MTEPFPYVNAAELRGKLPMAQAIEAMGAAFSDDVDNPMRIRLGKLLFMPARVGEFVGVKVVSSLPGDPAGTVTLYDAAGKQIGMIDGRALTLLRTGAAAGLATRLLARADATTLVMLGVGAVAPQQIEAACAVRHLRKIVLWGHNGVNAGFAQRIQADYPQCAVSTTQSADLAVQDADVIICATPARAPLFRASSVRPGTHINAMGAFDPGMIEVPTDCTASARVFVDDVHAAEREAGDLLQAKRAPDGELRDILAHRMIGRRDANEITLFKSVGIASQDVAAAVATFLGLAALFPVPSRDGRHRA